MPRKTVNMEEAFQELDAILEQLEEKDISLEDSFALYQKGMELVKTCEVFWHEYAKNPETYKSKCHHRR